MIEGLKEFIESGKETLELKIAPIDYIKRELEDLGFEWTDSDTNGWDVDFRYYFNGPHGKYYLLGSLWYGNYRLTKEE